MSLIAYRAVLMTLIIGLLFSSCKKEGVAVSEAVPATEAAKAQVSAGSDTSVAADPFLLSSITRPSGRFRAGDFGDTPAGTPNQDGDRGMAIGQPTSMLLKVNGLIFVFNKTLSNDPVAASYETQHLPTRPYDQLTVEGGNSRDEIKVQLKIRPLGNNHYLLTSLVLTFDGLGFNNKPLAVTCFSDSQNTGVTIKSLTVGRLGAGTIGVFDAIVQNRSYSWRGPTSIRVSGSFNIDAPKF